MLTILFVLALVFDMIVLYWNDALSILVLLTKKRYPRFLKKVFLFPENLFVFQKICVENIQNFQWLSHKNMLISQTEENS